jgi:hypothetical protein
MSNLRRQEEALAAMSYPRVSYSLQGDVGRYGFMQLVLGAAQLLGMGLQAVDEGKLADQNLTLAQANAQNAILADVAVKQQLAKNKAASAPTVLVVSILGVGIVSLVALKIGKVI